MNKSIAHKGVISTSERQITLFYNSKSQRGKQTLAYAKTHGLAIEEIDVLKCTITGTQIAELVNRLGIEIQDLVNQEHYKYRNKFIVQDFSCEDWITMIQNHPEIMKQPIALRGSKTILVETPTDIMKL
ncbi:hypothetical protein [Gelidibacter sp.]|uniref:arsenate reductase family protein n=1 Tax=Gelidibacter sp. TaxID=2018083 RepID=UPI002CACCD44|nr:hypothetical protein [Gelidibacter sp.]HUH29270.1 hypothetical protein [Gelidibacter sp.]